MGQGPFCAETLGCLNATLGVGFAWRRIVQIKIPRPRTRQRIKKSGAIFFMDLGLRRFEALARHYVSLLEWIQSRFGKENADR